MQPMTMMYRDTHAHTKRTHPKRTITRKLHQWKWSSDYRTRAPLLVAGGSFLPFTYCTFMFTCFRFLLLLYFSIWCFDVLMFCNWYWQPASHKEKDKTPTMIVCVCVCVFGTQPTNQPTVRHRGPTTKHHLIAVCLSRRSVHAALRVHIRSGRHPPGGWARVGSSYLWAPTFSRFLLFILLHRFVQPRRSKHNYNSMKVTLFCQNKPSSLIGHGCNTLERGKG